MATTMTQEMIPAGAVRGEELPMAPPDDPGNSGGGGRWFARLADDRARVVRLLARVLALLSLPGILWTLWALLFATPWAEQPFPSLLGQGVWVLAFIATLAGVVLAFRLERVAGGLLLGLGLSMLTWAVVGRVLDGEHWSGVFLLALGCLILPITAAGALLGMSSRLSRPEAVSEGRPRVVARVIVALHVLCADGVAGGSAVRGCAGQRATTWGRPYETMWCLPHPLPETAHLGCS
jgi:hypothetical protein